MRGKIPKSTQKPNKHPLAPYGRADLRTDVSPDSEQIEHTATKLQMRNSVSVEQIQDRIPPPPILSPERDFFSTRDENLTLCHI